jgi:hypothetical protein
LGVPRQEQGAFADERRMCGVIEGNIPEERRE